MKTAIKRIWLFLRIVWRDSWGGRLGPRLAWKVSEIIHPLRPALSGVEGSSAPALRSLGEVGSSAVKPAATRNPDPGTQNPGGAK